MVGSLLLGRVRYSGRMEVSTGATAGVFPKSDFSNKNDVGENSSDMFSRVSPVQFESEEKVSTARNGNAYVTR